MTDKSNGHLERVLRECAEAGVPDAAAPWDAIRNRVDALETDETRSGEDQRIGDRPTGVSRARRLLIPDHPLAWVLAAVSVLILGLGAYTASGLVGELIDRGMPGPASSGEKIFGTDKIDDISGTRHDDTIYALAGNDWVTDREGDNVAYGGDGNDWLTLSGSLYGGLGNDVLEPVGAGRVSGGPGADFVLAHNGKRDTISCGAGKDIVYFDKALDELAADCERQKPHQFKPPMSAPFGS